MPYIDQNGRKRDGSVDPMQMCPLCENAASDGHHELVAEVLRLRKAAKRAAEIIDVNLYHQREKVQDASAILKQAISKEI